TSLAEVLELAGSVVATGTLRHIDVERVVAIDKYMYLNVNAPILDDTIRVQYNQTERVRHVDEVQHTLAREALRYFHIDNGIEIVSVAGTGLGSSSCLLRWPAQCDAQPHSNPYQS
ncbi:MAG: kinase, partial [Acidobacteriaceae bacterium]|nr:kinase [Acidobacteriaceae bacterium]